MYAMSLINNPLLCNALPLCMEDRLLSTSGTGLIRNVTTDTASGTFCAAHPPECLPQDGCSCAFSGSKTYDRSAQFLSLLPRIKGDTLGIWSVVAAHVKLHLVYVVQNILYIGHLIIGGLHRVWRRIYVPQYTTSIDVINFTFTSFNKNASYTYNLGTAPGLSDVLFHEVRHCSAHSGAAGRSRTKARSCSEKVSKAPLWVEGQA